MAGYLSFRRYLLAVAAALFGAAAPFALAQEADIEADQKADQKSERVIGDGDIAVTGFPGTRFPANGIKPGIDPLDETFIDTEGASIRIFDVSATVEAPQGQLVYTPPPFEVKAGDVGLVFGLAFDDGVREGSVEKVPNLYATATSLFGVQIVAPDKDEDGRPERVKKGAPNTAFMTGQWGGHADAGPGTIYKIDGETGEVSLFADVTLDGAENSGPGLGNIAFDPATRQLFVSDLDTGMIHRFDLDGRDRGHFDHGTKGRPNRDLPAAAHDPDTRMDITSADFVADNPTTWGFAAKDRIVYGLAATGRRLYYAVNGKEVPQIWSVGIARDGSFEDDARWELDVKAETSHPVTDLVFDRRGRLTLAQRGFVKNPYDYAVFAVPATSQVLRYRKENPDNPETPSVWAEEEGEPDDEEPKEYAIGFPEGHRMATGGVDLGYGYDDGLVDTRLCDGTLATSGDDLRDSDDEDLKEKLTEGGPLHVHGLQLNGKGLVRPKNVPPLQSDFVDYDGAFDDPEVRGHVGDVEIWHPCEGRAAWNDIVPYPGDMPDLFPPGRPYVPDGPPGVPPIPPPPPPPAPECVELDWVEYLCNPGGFDALIGLRDAAGIGADSLKAQSLLPGISVSPSVQSRAGPDDPFYLDIQGAVPGDRVDMNICLYRAADAVPGRTFPCCKARLPLTLPPELCAP